MPWEDEQSICKLDVKFGDVNRMVEWAHSRERKVTVCPKSRSTSAYMACDVACFAAHTFCGRAIDSKVGKYFSQTLRDILFTYQVE